MVPVGRPSSTRTFDPSGATKVLSAGKARVANSLMRRFTRSLVDELPGIGAVEAPDPDRGDQAGVEVSEVHAVLGAWNGVERLPVRDAATGSAVHRPKRPVALDVADEGF